MFSLGNLLEAACLADRCPRRVALTWALVTFDGDWLERDRVGAKGKPI